MIVPCKKDSVKVLSNSIQGFQWIKTGDDGWIYKQKDTMITIYHPFFNQVIHQHQYDIPVMIMTQIILSGNIYDTYWIGRSGINTLHNWMDKVIPLYHPLIEFG